MVLLQDLTLESGEPLFLHVADRCREWNDGYPANVGMVVGAIALYLEGNPSASPAQVTGGSSGSGSKAGGAPRVPDTAPQRSVPIPTPR